MDSSDRSVAQYLCGVYSFICSCVYLTSTRRPLCAASWAERHGRHLCSRAPSGGRPGEDRLWGRGLGPRPRAEGIVLVRAHNRDIRSISLAVSHGDPISTMEFQGFGDQTESYAQHTVSTQ